MLMLKADINVHLLTSTISGFEGGHNPQSIRTCLISARDVQISVNNKILAL
jgi:hypothetical protein